MKKILVALSLLLFLTACSEEKSKISYTVYPIEFLLERIAGDRIDSEKVSDEATILRSQVKDNYQDVVDDSDLLIYFSGLEPYMLSHFSSEVLGSIDLLDISAKTNIYQFNRYTTINTAGSSIVVEGKYYDNPVFDTIDTYTSDPYIWMDPIAMISMANQITTWLSNRYPQDSDFFNANLEKLKYDLAYLDTEYQQLKKRTSPIQIVTLTPSFGPWQKNYGIQVYPVVLSRFGALPTNQQFELIKQRIIQDGVKYIAYEEDMPKEFKDLYDRLVLELGLESITLSNLSYRSQKQIESNKDYIQIMYDNLIVLEGLE